MRPLSNISERLRSLRFALSWLLIVGFGAFFLLSATRLPDGAWDAWAFWNSRAKAIYFTDYVTAYRDFPAIPHPDYPPLLSLTVAAGWKLTGAISPVVPTLIQGAILLALLIQFRRCWWALLIVGTAAVQYAPYQYGDVALSLAFLAAVMGLIRRSEILTGIGLGFCLLLKNEGVLMTFSTLAIWILLVRRVPARTLLVVGLCATVLAAHKLVVQAPNDLFAEGGTLERATDLSRYTIIVPYMIEQIFSFAGGMIWFVVLRVLIYRPRLQHIAPALVVSLFIWLGYMAIYIITPRDLEWHLATSYDRLIMQLFPSLVYAISWPLFAQPRDKN